MAAYNLAPILNGTTIFGGNTAGSTPNLPLVSGQLWTYAAGTTTPLGAYQTPTGTIWSNPIVLDSAGRIPGLIYFPNGVAYKFVLKDSLGNTIPDATFDNLMGIGDTSGFSSISSEWVATGFVPTYGGTTTFSTPGNTTSTFQIGRRVQATVTAGTVYGTVVSATYGTTTTVVLDMDQGQVLDIGLTVVNVGLLGTTGTGVSVPMDWVNDLTLRNLTATGTANVTGTATVGSVSTAGNITASGSITTSIGTFGGSGAGLTGTATSLTIGGTSTGLSGTSPQLGSNWKIDANGQLSNSGQTMEVACFYSSTGTASGNAIVYNNTHNNNGGFTLNTGTGVITITNPGYYEAIAVQNVATWATQLNLYFNTSGSTTGYGCIGPGSAPPGLSLIYGTGAYVFAARFLTTASNVTISSYTGGVNSFGGGFATLSPGSYIIIRRIA